LYRGWWITVWREVPAFGAYFAFYDIFKDKINSYFVQRDERLAKEDKQRQQLQQQQNQMQNVSDQQQQSYFQSLSVDVIATDDNSSTLALGHHTHTWLSSALAGGLTGALTW
jgi:hypothetical protein